MQITNSASFIKMLTSDDIDAALRFAEETALLADKIDSDLYRIAAAITKGTVLAGQVSLGTHEEGLAILRQAIIDGLGYGDPGIIGRGYINLCSALETLDRHQEAVQVARAGLAELDAEMNTLRKHFSAVKGGRLAALAGSATQCTLLISDVPPGMDHAIGSGPWMPDPTTTADCRRLLEGAVSQHIPPRIRAYLADACLAETPKADDECFRNAQWRTILRAKRCCTPHRRSARPRAFTP